MDDFTPDTATVTDDFTPEVKTTVEDDFTPDQQPPTPTAAAKEPDFFEGIMKTAAGLKDMAEKAFFQKQQEAAAAQQAAQIADQDPNTWSAERFRKEMPKPEDPVQLAQYQQTLEQKEKSEEEQRQSFYRAQYGFDPVKQQKEFDKLLSPEVRIEMQKPQTFWNKIKSTVANLYLPDSAKAANITNLASYTGLDKATVSKHYDQITQELGLRSYPNMAEITTAGMLLALPVTVAAFGPLAVAKGIASYTAVQQGMDRAILPAAKEVYQALKGDPIKYEVTTLTDILPPQFKDIGTVAELVLYGKGAHEFSKIMPSDNAIIGKLANIRHSVLKKLNIKNPPFLEQLNVEQMKEAFPNTWQSLVSEKELNKFYQEKAKNIEEIKNPKATEKAAPAKAEAPEPKISDDFVADPAPSVISYVTPEGEKLYTKLTPEEYELLKAEPRIIPAASGGENQIHLDADTSALRQVGKEVSREDFVNGHSQAGKLLSRTANPDETAALTKMSRKNLDRAENTVSDMAEKLYNNEPLPAGEFSPELIRRAKQRVISRIDSEQQQAGGKIRNQKQQIRWSLKNELAQDVLKDLADSKSVAPEEMAQHPEITQPYSDVKVAKQKVEELTNGTDAQREARITEKVSSALSQSEKEAVSAGAKSDEQGLFETAKRQVLADARRGLEPGTAGKADALEVGKVEPVEVKGTGETKARGLAAGVEAKAIENRLTKGFGDLPEYKTVNVQDQANQALELLQRDYELAKRIALGQEEPPKGILPESVFVAVENKAIADGDVSLLRDLATGSDLTHQATTMGQRIRMLAERDPESPAAAMKSVLQAREKAATGRLKVKNVGEAKARIAEDIKSSINQSKPKAKDWASFIQSLQC